MPYSKQTWVDGDDTKPLSAARMGVIETGIQTAQAGADASVKQVRVNGVTTSPTAGLVDLGTIAGGGGSSAVRDTATLTTNSLAANAQQATTIPLATSYRLLTIATSRPARVRLYATTAARDADLARAATATPATNSGLWVDVVTGTGVLTVILAEAIDGASLETTASANAPITVTNLDSTTGTVAVTITYLRAGDIVGGGGGSTDTSAHEAATDPHPQYVQSVNGSLPDDSGNVTVAAGGAALPYTMQGVTLDAGAPIPGDLPVGAYVFRRPAA